jgi:hypothetical protein
MTIHEGSCHCGAVHFQIEADVALVIDCNCSICTKKGIVHVPVKDEHFTLTAGDDSLSVYTFGSGDARHWFCRRCGIHTHGRPRSAPERYTVNARCLDSFTDVVAAASVREFDGVNHPKDEI